ncbi:ClpXP protease specificity-enhancing factor SspB [Asticcacaulis sp. EMRT-3]|uniref:SspB family protein n=1 Tax=Asticcacaulis sp. EMRT-3 TaxID=3040349 RepID=UPI0024AFA469|nr:ClpXP protease specificity-enhancing factor SspB [Asticcacaulis sp. EMRT-3]MDI7775254.1 ClpXP protease specificity-enhancing factor SspB [Asticcacaulis sp. EMRT-3]
MSEEPMIIDQMDYAGMTQNALRGVIRQALQRADDPEGLPGEHHFYITFLTRAPGVSIPPDLLARYPFDITIVLQHQYRDLRVADDFFRVTLAFGGAPKILTVPYAAISRFHDPYAQFMLEFEVDDPASLTQDIEDPERSDDTPEAPATARADNAASPDDDGTPKIISLDQFRKK